MYPQGVQGYAGNQGGYAQQQQQQQQPMIEPGMRQPWLQQQQQLPMPQQQQQPMIPEEQEEPPVHNPSLGGGPHRRVLGASDVVERVPMTTSNSYIYYARLAVGTPRQKDIHVILDTGSSVFAIFAVPHGGPTLLVICLLVAACILGATSIGLLALSWYQGRYEEMQEGLEGKEALLDDEGGESLNPTA